jgi:hypothetical protein
MKILGLCLLVALALAATWAWWAYPKREVDSSCWAMSRQPAALASSSSEARISPTMNASPGRPGG